MSDDWVRGNYDWDTKRREWVEVGCGTCEHEYEPCDEDTLPECVFCGHKKSLLDD